MFCIRCTTAMKQKVLNGVLLDFCPNCRGIWVDRGELRKLNTFVIASYVALKRQARIERSEEAVRAGFVRAICQRCNGTMTVTNDGSISYEKCASCGGSFFDYMELDKILQERTRWMQFLDWLSGIFAGS